MRSHRSARESSNTERDLPSARPFLRESEPDRVSRDNMPAARARIVRRQPAPIDDPHACPRRAVLLEDRSQLNRAQAGGTSAQGGRHLPGATAPGGNSHRGTPQPGPGDTPRPASDSGGMPRPACGKPHDPRPAGDGLTQPLSFPHKHCGTNGPVANSEATKERCKTASRFRPGGHLPLRPR